jgi:hypothetical protein
LRWPVACCWLSSRACLPMQAYSYRYEPWFVERHPKCSSAEVARSSATRHTTQLPSSRPSNAVGADLCDRGQQNTRISICSNFDANQVGRISGRAISLPSHSSYSHFPLHKDLATTSDRISMIEPNVFICAGNPRGRRVSPVQSCSVVSSSLSQHQIYLPWSGVVHRY